MQKTKAKAAAAQTVSAYIEGRLLYNYKRRNARDPFMLGYIDMPDGSRLSVGSYEQCDENGRETEGAYNLTLKPFGLAVKPRLAGSIEPNYDLRAKVAPNYAGDVKWKGRMYSVAGWINESPTGLKPYINLRLMPAEQYA